MSVELDQSNIIIKSLWIGEKLSPLEQLCINSFLKNGHQFFLYSYGPVDNVPNGTEIKDANTIISQNRMFKDSFGTYASFADWFRYKLLCDYGGWWVDMDVICLKHFNFQREFCFATEKKRDEEGYIISNAVIKSEASAEFLIEILDHIEFVLGSEENPTVNWGEFGPQALHNLLSGYDCQVFVEEPVTFCPVHWYEVEKIVSNQNQVELGNSYAVHLWNRLWGLQGFDKEISYSDQSLIEALKNRYCETADFKGAIL